MHRGLQISVQWENVQMKKKVKYRYCPHCRKDTVTIKDNAGIDYVIVCGTCGHAWIQTK